MTRVYKKKRIIALILSVLVLGYSLPKLNVFGSGQIDGAEPPIVLEVSVLDAKGHSVNDAKIYVGGLDDAADDNYTCTYENDKYILEFTDLVDEDYLLGKSIEAKAKDLDNNEVVDSINYASARTEYELVLEEEWEITNEEMDKNEDGSYVIETDCYIPQYGKQREYIVHLDRKNNKFNFEIDDEKIPCAIETCDDENCDDGKCKNATVSKVNSIFGATNDIKFLYETPGKAKVICKPIDRFYKDVVIYVNIDNDVEFNISKNNELLNSKYNVEYSDAENTIISGVTEKISRNDAVSGQKKIEINATTNCNEDIKYYLSRGNENLYSVNTNGEVTATAKGSFEVMAISVATGKKAYYQYTISGYDETMSFDTRNNSFNHRNNKIEIDLEDYIDGTKLDIKGKAPNGLESKYSNFTYSSSDTDVAEVDENTGAVTIKKGGNVNISVTATGSGFFNDISNSYEIIINQMPAVIVVKSDSNVIGEETIINIADTDDKFTYFTDAEQINNGNTFELPLQIFVDDIDVSDDCVVTANGLIIDTVDGKFIVKNPDDIKRNAVTEFTITTVLDSNVYVNTSKNVKIYVEGVKENYSNIGYVCENTISAGADGNKWINNRSESVVFKATSTYKLSMSKGGELVDSVTFPFVSSDNANVEFKFYAVDASGNYYVQRKYFGIDAVAPIINEISFDNATTVTRYGVYSKNSITLTVDVVDAENNLYDVSIFDREAFEEAEDNIATDISAALMTQPVTYNDEGQLIKPSFEISANDEANKNKVLNYVVVVRDKAGNYQAKSIKELISNLSNNEIIIDTVKPVVDINANYSESNATKFKGKDGKIYVDRDLVIEGKITEVGNSSGIKSYKVSVNNQIFTEKNYIASNVNEKIKRNDFKINTANFAKINGMIKVRVYDVVDFAGNVLDEKTFVIYVDDNSDLPKATLSGKTVKGYEQITSYGNFYNNAVKFEVKLTDKLSGVKSAYAVIDGKKQNLKLDIDSKGKTAQAEFEIPVNTAGNISITVIDNLGNRKNWSLKEISSQDIKYISSYVCIEKNKFKFTFTPSRKPDADGKWYNHGLSVSCKAEEIGDIKSGIKSVEVFINDEKFDEFSKEYNGRNDYVFMENVAIDDSLVEELRSTDGSYKIQIVIEDNAGNKMTSSKVINIDIAAPTIDEIIGVVNGNYYVSDVALQVVAIENNYESSDYKVYLDVTRELDGKVEKTTMVGPEATAEIEYFDFIIREEGKYTIVVNATDGVGNKAVGKTISFIIDKTNPICNITGVTTNGIYSDVADVSIEVIESNYDTNNVRISATKEFGGNKVDIPMDQFKGTGKNTTINRKFTEEGRYTVTVDAVDKAGNKAVAQTISFFVDADTPNISISGVENNMVYIDDITPKIDFSDSFYKGYSVKLYKTGVYFGDSRLFITDLEYVDVTNQYITNVSTNEHGGNIIIDGITKDQKNDGIYTLEVSVEDKAGKISTQNIVFSVNRFGSVYTFDEKLIRLNGNFILDVGGDFVIKEYSPVPIDSANVVVTITRDGTPLENVDVELALNDRKNQDQNWYEYEYTISKNNFKLDGVYALSVSSTNDAGKVSQSIMYDEFEIKFSVDKTKPDIVSVIGLEKNSYNAESIAVEYEIFDASKLKEVTVYIDDKLVDKIDSFEDMTSYKGVVNVTEGTNRHVRIVAEDWAGNIIDSDNDADIALGKVAEFVKEVTVSTNVFVIWYSNKIVFYSSIVGTVVFVLMITAFIVFKKKRKSR